MATLEQVKSDIATKASEIAGLEINPELLELANPKAGSHLALPCFRFSGELGKSPVEVAEIIAGGIRSEHLEKIEFSGPYVNFWLSGNLLASIVNEQKDQLLEDAADNGKTVIVEFLSPNLAKPLSIGHLRNALQGKVLALNFKNAGYKLVIDNHIGDWGTVFGMWVVGFERFSSEEDLARDGVKELGRMYVEVRKALKQEKEQGGDELKNNVQDWLMRLEEGDEEAKEYHARFTEISLDNITKRMAELGIVFDHNLGESFFIERGKEIVGELLEAGQAIRNDDGSVIIQLEDQGIDVPLLIEKSNGASLYATSDIATIEYREKVWDPEIVVYVVGAEQQFHFNQLFAANRKIGWSDAELEHHWYGLIEEVDENGDRRKMSSRENAVYLSDLLDQANERAHVIAPEELEEGDILKIAHGAVFFREFSGGRKGNVLFDWETMFSLSGFSGPYVQYAAVRISSILAKTSVDEISKPENYDWSEYADIFWLLARYQSVINEALEQREFHKIAEFAYELAKQWNRFYENDQVLDSGEDEGARLWLAKTIHQYLERSLYLIGIEIPSKM